MRRFHTALGLGSFLAIAGATLMVPTISSAEMAHLSSHANPSQATNLDALHHSLTTPSRHQQETAAFSLSAASYNHLTNPEDPDPFLSNPEDEYLDAKPSRLQAAYASMQEARGDMDRVIAAMEALDPQPESEAVFRAEEEPVFEIVESYGSQFVTE